MPYLKMENLWKRYGHTAAVAGISLEIEQGEFVSLLGPSGCGKTTTLRLVAGLIAPESGEIWLQGEPITKIPVPMREIGMVFQSWALFPNMTAEQNIGFPLKIRKLPKKQIASRVTEILDLVGLGGLENRFPHELSGGQQQRVGLGRALARDPRVLLLDEPLSALDAPVRRSLIVEIRRLQRQLGITTLYVTHDQEEALSMSDRVAVMNQGRIVEVGTPEGLYREPESAFAATFIGATNILLGEVIDIDRAQVQVGGIKLPVVDLRGSRVGSKVRVLVRPEDVRFFAQPPLEGTYSHGKIVIRTFLGATTRFDTLCGEIRFRVDVPSSEATHFVGTQDVWLSFVNPSRIIEVLDN
jgi:putative spermidine/putrescine transport system ATP-binding protein